MTELGMISQAFQFAAINKVAGDYMEFGLWRGKTFCYAYRMKQRFRFNEMLLWGFDSFAGLPPVTDERDNVWQTGEFSCSEQQFREILKKRGLKTDEYSLICILCHGSGARMPVMTLRRVDLPEPLRPMKATVSPRGIVNETPSSAANSRRDFRRSG